MKELAEDNAKLKEELHASKDHLKRERVPSYKNE
jgi:hypothetical protein